MTTAADLEQQLLIALLDGMLERDDVRDLVDRSAPAAEAEIDSVIAELVSRGLVVRGTLSADGFAPAPLGRWLKRTREGELRAGELASAPARGFSPRKKTGRCG